MKVKCFGVLALVSIVTVSTDTAQRSKLLPRAPALVQKLLASDGVANDEFGLSVDIAGSTAVVGAWQLPRTGEAYVYERDLGGPDAWGEAKILRASNPSTYEWFGNDVAIQGDRIVVGAPRRGASGAAVVFERDVGGPDAWGEVAELVPAGAASRFGHSVALDGDRIAVGAPFSRTLHVFERDAGGSGAWIEVAVLRPPAPIVPSAVFGVSVALEGDRIAVGDPEFGLATLPGSAYVFERDPFEGGWTLVKKLRPITGGVNFGLDVALAGELVAVGGDPRRVYLHDRDQGGSGAWGLVKLLERPEPGFGNSLDLDGERLAVGYSCPNLLPPYICTVFVFERHLGGENAFGELARVASPPDDEESFGYAVGLSAGHLLVGAYEDDELAPDAGAAFVWRLAARPSPLPGPRGSR